MKVRIGMNEYEARTVGELTQHEFERMAWVSDSLSPLLESLGTGITKVEYVSVAEGVEHLLVWFGDSYKTVNVSADSLAAMVEDCYRQHVIY